MKRSLLTLLLALALTGGVYAVLRGHGKMPYLSTEPVTSGDIVRAVVADGTLQTVDTVQVGAQVTGTIIEVNADFNDVVHEGQVLARFDPKPATDDVERARAAVAQATADLEGARVVLADAKFKLDEAKGLAAHEVIPPEDLEAADIAYREADDGVRVGQAAVVQAQAALKQAEIDLDHTIIRAPINGIVIARNVEPGETVAARLDSPLLFQIASDLKRMQAVANIDESDVGLVKEGQPVAFTVDAYPARTFAGVVEQVRAGADTSDNEVTYATVIKVDNDDLKLRPGMTAVVRIEVARHPGVLRVPQGALRFAPSAAMFAALRQPVPPDLERLSRPPRTFENATAILWIRENGRLRPERVKTGLTDGTAIEVSSDNLREGMQVVTDGSI
jgi:HlyD family secretion protein